MSAQRVTHLQRRARVTVVAELADRTKPVSLAHERLLPAVPGIASLLPEGGLRRGTTLSVVGSTSLVLAVAAGPSSAGSWCAAVGAPDLGVVAAAEIGIALERFPLIAPARTTWTRTVGVALEAFDVVLAWPMPGLSGPDARRLAALGRDRGAVLVLCGPGWPERTDLRLEAIGSRWLGLDQGHGRLRARRLEVVVAGRGAASALRRAALWLPGPDGRIAPDAGQPEHPEVGAEPEQAPPLLVEALG
jgi:hypothetical protein